MSKLMCFAKYEQQISVLQNVFAGWGDNIRQSSLDMVCFVNGQGEPRIFSIRSKTKADEQCDLVKFI